VTAILDASALLALMFKEPGQEQVALQAQGSKILSVNYTEVVAKYLDRGGTAQLIDAIVDRLEIEVSPFDRHLALIAAELRAKTAHIGASLADRACLAFATLTRLPVYTADRDWSKLDLGLEIRLIR
jgi:PIN domain nuclease of toxin-antitoxin system